MMTSGCRKNCVTLCDLGIIADQAAEPVPPENPVTALGASGCGLPAGGPRCSVPAERQAPAMLPEPPATGRYPRFAALIAQGAQLEVFDAAASQVLATPAEFTSQLGLQDLVSPLRMRGMSAMLARIKRQIRGKQADRRSRG